MGCDIHCNLEYKRSRESNWCDIDLYKKNKCFGIDGYEDEPEFWKVSLYNGRSYFLFGLLAGVRNYNVEPIIEPRGIPDDVSESIKKYYDDWGSDAHTPSWYTLYELKRAQKTLNELVLQELIDAIELRYIQSENYGYKKSLTEDEENNIRLVFWFDN